MSSRLSKFEPFLVNCSKNKVDPTTLDNHQVEVLVEICHNIAVNPKVLLSAAELRCLESDSRLIFKLSDTLQVQKARVLLGQLKRKTIGCIARVALQYETQP